MSQNFWEESQVVQPKQPQTQQNFWEKSAVVKQPAEPVVQAPVVPQIVPPATPIAPVVARKPDDLKNSFGDYAGAFGSAISKDSINPIAFGHYEGQYNSALNDLASLVDEQNRDDQGLIKDEEVPYVGLVDKNVRLQNRQSKLIQIKERLKYGKEGMDRNYVDNPDFRQRMLQSSESLAKLIIPSAIAGFLTAGGSTALQLGAAATTGGITMGLQGRENSLAESLLERANQMGRAGASYQALGGETSDYANAENNPAFTISPGQPLDISKVEDMQKLMANQGFVDQRQSTANKVTAIDTAAGALGAVVPGLFGRAVGGSLLRQGYHPNLALLGKHAAEVQGVVGGAVAQQMANNYVKDKPLDENLGDTIANVGAIYYTPKVAGALTRAARNIGKGKVNDGVNPTKINPEGSVDIETVKPFDPKTALPTVEPAPPVEQAPPVEPTPVAPVSPVVTPKATPAVEPVQPSPSSVFTPPAPVQPIAQTPAVAPDGSVEPRPRLGDVDPKDINAINAWHAAYLDWNNKYEKTHDWWSGKPLTPDQLAASAKPVAPETPVQQTAPVIAPEPPASVEPAVTQPAPQATPEAPVQPVPQTPEPITPDVNPISSTTTDVTPPDLAPQNTPNTPTVEGIMKGESMDDAMERKVGYQVGNGRAKITHNGSEWVISVANGDGTMSEFKAFDKRKAIQQAFVKLYPNTYLAPHNESQVPVGSTPTTPAAPASQAPASQAPATAATPATPASATPAATNAPIAQTPAQQTPAPAQAPSAPATQATVTPATTPNQTQAAPTAPAGNQPSTPGFSQVKQVDFGNGQFGTVVEHQIAGHMKSGIDVVKTPADLAHVVGQWFAERPQETLAVVSLDKNGKILNISRQSIGGITSTNVFYGLLGSAAMRFEGSKNVFVIHNHPSKKAEFSPADESVNKITKDLLKKSGVTYSGAMVIAGDEYSFVDPKGKKSEGLPIPNIPRTLDIPFTERIYQKNDTLSGVKLDDPKITIPEVPKLLNGKTGVVFLNNKLLPVGTLELPISKMIKLRQADGISQLLTYSERANAKFMIVNIGDGLTSIEIDQIGTNMNRAGTAIDVKALDMIGDGKSYESLVTRYTGPNFNEESPIEPAGTSPESNKNEISPVVGAAEKAMLDVAGKPMSTRDAVNLVVSAIGSSENQRVQQSVQLLEEIARSKIGGLEVKFVNTLVKTESSYVGGIYNSDAKVIEISIPGTIAQTTSGAKISEILAHEVVHYHTIDAIRYDTDYKNEVTNLLSYTKQWMENNGIKTTDYGMTNEREFLTEGMTNPQFRKLLKGIPALKGANSTLIPLTKTKLSVYNKLVKSIKDMFARNGVNVEGTVLEDVINSYAYAKANMDENHISNLTSTSEAREAMSWNDPRTQTMLDRANLKPSNPTDLGSVSNQIGKPAYENDDNTIYVPTGVHQIGSTPGVTWGSSLIETTERKGGSVKAFKIKEGSKILTLHTFELDKNGNVINDINQPGFDELKRIAEKYDIDITPWDRKTQEFTNPESLSGDEIFTFNPNKITEGFGSAVALGPNNGFGEQLLDAIKKEGYDIIKTMTQEGEATMILNNKSVVQKTIDDNNSDTNEPGEGIKLNSAGLTAAGLTAASSLSTMDMIGLASVIAGTNDKILPGLNPIVANMHLIAEEAGSGTALAVANMFGNRGGNTPAGAKETYDSERDSNARIFRGDLVNAFEPLAKLSEDQIRAKSETLAAAMSGEITLTGPDAEVVKRMKTLADEIRAYAREAGVEVGYVDDYGMPHSIDVGKVQADEKGFLAAAEAAYRENNPLRIKKLTDKITKLNDKLNNTGKLTAEEMKQYEQLKTERDELAVAKPEVQAEEYLNGISFGNEGGDMTLGLILKGEATNTNNANFLKGRIFEPSARKILRKWFNNDPRHAWNGYINRMTKIAEFSRRFGHDGSKWAVMVKQMRKEGMTNRQITDVRNMVLDSLGALNPRPTPEHALANSLLGLSNMAKLKTTAVTVFLEAQSNAMAGNLGDAVTAPLHMLGNVIAYAAEMTPSQRATFRKYLGFELNTATGSMELARICGVIDAVGVHDIMQNSAHNIENASEVQGNTRTAKVARGISGATAQLARSFLLENVENSKRATATRYAVNRLSQHVDELLNDNMLARAHERLKPGAINPFTVKNEARMRLRKAGVSDVNADDFCKWWQEAVESGDFNVRIADRMDPMAAIARKAIRMEGNRATVTTGRTNKLGGKEGAMISQDTFWGKGAMTFLNYPTTFREQVGRPFAADMRRAYKGYDTDGKDSTYYSAYERVRMAARASSIPAMAITAAAWLAFRTWMNGDDESWEKYKALHPLKKAQQAVTYTGVTGGKSEFISRAERGQFVPILDEGARLGRNLNLPDNARNTKERAVAKETVRSIGTPALQAVSANYLPLPAAVVVNQVLGSKQFKEAVVDLTAGEKQPTGRGDAPKPDVPKPPRPSKANK